MTMEEEYHDNEKAPTTQIINNYCKSQSGLLSHKIDLPALSQSLRCKGVFFRGFHEILRRLLSLLFIL